MLSEARRGAVEAGRVAVSKTAAAMPGGGALPIQTRPLPSSSRARRWKRRSSRRSASPASSKPHIRVRLR